MIFDRTVVREIDGAYTVLRLGIRGANEEQQKFYDAVARNALSLAAGYEDVKGPLGDIEQLQNRITAEMQLQGKLRLDDQTFVERINSELATYNQRVSDITTKLRDAQGSNFSDVGDQIASLAQATSDAAERIKANRGVISSPFDTSEAAANARQAASQVRSTFQQQVANVLAQPGITPEGALQQIQALQANLIDVARKAGADRQTIETIRGLIQVPDLKLAGDSIRIADSEQVQREELCFAAGVGLLPGTCLHEHVRKDIKRSALGVTGRAPKTQCSCSSATAPPISGTKRRKRSPTPASA